ncbi:GtrA family protein [Zoogloea sp.]|uniref:GtrA family protein n=1 Tax=Zoogloea sp. TaxID=49181 RepID=UPI0031FDE802
MTPPPAASRHAALRARIAGFAGVGLIGTAAHYAVLVGCVQRLGVDPVRASMLGALVGAVMNYLLNYHWNYRSTRSHLRTGPRFFAIAAASFALNGALMAWLVNALATPYLAAQLAVTAVVFLVNFTANHMWTFRGH